MDQLNCFVCNDQIQGSLDGLFDHLTHIHELTIIRHIHDSGFECRQDGCKRKYIRFSSLRKHIEDHHLQPNQPFEEVIVPQENFFYYDENDGDDDDDDEDDEVTSEKNIFDDEENIPLSQNNQNTDFNLRQLIEQMIVRFRGKGIITGALLTDVLNEFENIILSMQNFFKLKIQTFLRNRKLLDDEEAKLILKTFNFNNIFDELRPLNQPVEILKKHLKYVGPDEITWSNQLDQIIDRKIGERIKGAELVEVNEDTLKNLKIKLGPKKVLLKLASSTNKPEEIINSHGMEEKGSMTSSISKKSNPSKDDSSITLNSNSSSFSRYGTVKKTLQKDPRGFVILNAAKSSFTEKHRKSLIRITVSELVKLHDSHYPPDSAKTALAQAIVAEFPRLRNDYSSGGYEHYYDEQTKKGFIEFRLWTLRKKLSPSRKKNRKTVNEASNTTIDIEKLSEEEMNEKISMMKCTAPTKENKSMLIQTLEDTHAFRRHWITTKKPTLTQILQMYPRLKDYNGEMVNDEFKKLFPESNNNLILKFPSYYTPHILQYAKKFSTEVFRKSQKIKDEQLRALLILTELLPGPNAIKNKRNEINDKGKKRLFSERNKEENMTLKPDFPNQELLQFISENTDIEQIEETIQNQSWENAQPCLVLMNGKTEGKSFIKGDGWLIKLLESFSPLQAFDILYKFFRIFNLEYPRSLLNFYNFMDTYIYQISSNPHSVVSSLHINICNVEMEENNDSD